MFRSRSAAARLDALHAARIADLNEAHAARVRDLGKLIDVLAEQVEYLRATFGRPHIASRPTTPGLAWPDKDPYPITAETAKRFLSEEEEDILALRENDLISQAEAERLAAALQANIGAPVSIET